MQKHTTSLEALLLVGQNIRRWRRHREIKQSDLARSLGVNKSCISCIENGKMDLSLSRINMIAQILGVTPQQLFTCPQEALTNEHPVPVQAAPHLVKDLSSIFQNKIASVAMYLFAIATMVV